VPKVITDSVECVMHAERLDGFVGLAGCDKSIPGMLMAAARLDLPSVFVYNGSILPGHHNGVALDITSVFEAVAPHASGTMEAIEAAAHYSDRGRAPACYRQHDGVGGRASASLPGSACAPAVDRRRDDDALRSGRPSSAPQGHPPRQIA
jgi:dihydroxy-acid dehydratase